MPDFTVEIRRTNQKMHFEGVSGSNPNHLVPFDFAPPLGDGEGFAGLELLLMSFAGCFSTTVVFLLGRLGKHLESYAATAEGIRSEQPLALREIRLMIRIQSKEITRQDMDSVIQQAQALAPVGQAIRNNVGLQVAYELS